jgi:putative inorganic carbon (hco3(-)) transporter
VASNVSGLSVDDGRFWGRRVSGFVAELFADVHWSPSFLALLYYSFSVITFRITGSRYAMIVALAGLTLELQHIRWTAGLTWLAALIGWAYVSAIMTGGHPIAMTGAEDLAKVAVICFVIFNAIRSAAQLRFYIAFVVGCFLLYPTRGALINYIGGYTTFGRALWNYAYSNPNDLAGFALLFLSLTLAYLYIGRHKLWRYGAVAASGALVLLILLTQSRGAFLALVATTFLALVVSQRRGRSFLTVGAIAVLAVPFVPSSAWTRFSNLSKVSTESGMKGVDSEGSAEQRFQVMQLAARIAKANPLFGVGPNMYKAVSREYGRENASEFPMARSVGDPHNTYLKVATELGLPGLLLFCGMVAAVLGRAWRTSNRLIARGVGSAQVFRMICFGFIAFLLAGLFSSIPYINMLYILIAIVSSLSMHADDFLMTASPAATPVDQRRVPQLRPMGVRGGLSAVGR